jgi:tetratricopeptide (TPR) repeat protein
MLPCAANRAGRSSKFLALAMCAIATFSSRSAWAQVAPGDGVPSRVYFNTFPLFFDGEFRNALGAFQAESRGSIHSPTSRWIDSICYFTMMGECYYQLGQLPAALDSYNSALKLYVAYSNWMMRVQFPPVIMPATVGAIRVAPWGQSKRGAAIGQFPETFLLGQGQVDQTAVVMQGGVVQNPILIPVHVSEIVRATSLAIRRRRELLGPLCKHDPLTNTLVEVLSGRAGPANHWSEAWISVELGCALSAAGNAAQAKTTLERAILVGGQFDHPLTSTALLELGRLSLEAGDFTAAIRYFDEASYASLAFPNPTNLEEAFRFGALAHLLLNQKTPYPPLAPAIVWAKSQGNRQLQTSLLVLAAENMASLGDPEQAAGFLAGARQAAVRSDLAGSQLGARMNHVTALVAYQSGNLDAGDQALAAALTFQRTGSLWMFYIAQTDSRYLNAELSDRTGLSLYETVLRDPIPADWIANPLECLSTLTIGHEAAFEHWFEAALKNSKEHELALEIADRARRHRFFSTLPAGGRLLALRWVLEGPLALLGERGLLERQDLLTRYPRYAQLSKEAAKIRATLAEKPIVADTPDARRHQSEQLAALASASQSQELILREIAVRREPAEMVFPPLRKTKDIQQALPEGQVLLAFFATSRNLYAFLYSREKYAVWHVNSPALLQKQITNLLREMGNFDSNHELTAAEMAKGAWRSTAAKVMNLLLERSNVDLAGNFDEIVIVPDGALWYVPFEALPVGKGDQQKPLIAQARVRYAPTVGLAVAYSGANKPRPNVGVVLGKLHPQDHEGMTTRAFEQLAPTVPGAVALPFPLPAASGVYRSLLDGLIVLDDIEPGEDVYEWSPSQLDRGKAAGSLASWFSLPWGGPQQIILPGYHTAAENGLRKGAPTGQDLFLSVCGLMATGARTILISRWRTGGQSSLDLVREFAQELPHTSPAEAWQRSVRVAGDTPLEPEHEPRMKKGSWSGEPPMADHPFFWAGYLLVDSGTLTKEQDDALKLPGLGAPNKTATAPAANPPLLDKAAKDAADPAPPEASAPSKRGKKAKSPPRAPPKKVSPRPKPARDRESDAE